MRFTSRQRRARAFGDASPASAALGGLLLAWLVLTGGASHAAGPLSEDMRDHPRDGWLSNGGNLANQRYSPLREIDAANVGRLKGLWLTHLNGSGVGPPFSGEAQPIVYQGVIYVVTGADDVFAVDADDGAIRWVYESGLDPDISTICCGWTSRGVAIGEGRLYLGRLDGRLVALDAASGEVLWSVETERWQDGYTITSAPLYYDGLVIVGYAGAEYGVRGLVRAFDAASGAPRWTFHTVPGPGEFGHDTWPAGSDAWRRGGGTVWHTPAVDPERGLLYFSTGNAGPDFNGAVRAGDNLFTASIVALDVHSGAYRWHFQEVHHDIWDYDAANPVVLFDVELDGRIRHAIAQAGKTGWVYLLDRTDGTPLLGIEERAVPQEPRQLTSPTQPYPVGDAFAPQAMEMPLYGYEFVNGGRIFTPFWKQPIPARPSAFGAAVWAPSSYDPDSHTLYVCAMDLVGLFSGGEDAPPRPGQQYLNGRFVFDTQRSGIFAAMDLTTNRLRWRQRWRDSCYSGSTTTAGKLVFTGHNDGRFAALDARNGRVLWEFQTGAGVNAPPAVFEHRGRQVVAVYAAGALFAQSPPGDNLWLFGLYGTLDELPPPSGPSAAEALFAATADAPAGAELFQRYCGQCHGRDGSGGHGGGPNLHRALAPDHVLVTIRAGRGGMPAFAGTLDETEISAIAAHVATLSGAP
ncbi:MAG: PQQ-binding-like beta-propeller repeat protein [Gammaproteobacteria bacterium]|nr:PQQ-binding-like beta-propeller repeat protein [Gammaproteobacteria bacterium]